MEIQTTRDIDAPASAVWRGIRSFVGELETIVAGAPEHASTADALAS